MHVEDLFIDTLNYYYLLHCEIISLYVSCYRITARSKGCKVEVMCQRTAQGKLPHTKTLIQSSEKVRSIVAHPLCIYVLTTDMKNDK